MAITITKLKEVPKIAFDKVYRKTRHYHCTGSRYYHFKIRGIHLSANDGKDGMNLLNGTKGALIKFTTQIF